MKKSRRNFITTTLFGLASIPLLTECTEDVSSINLLSLDATQLYPAGSIQDIRWKYLGIKAVRIEFSPNAGETWELLAADIPAKEQSWRWQLPTTPTRFGLIRISDASNRLIQDVSAAPFSIQTAYEVVLTDHVELEAINGVFTIDNTPLGDIAVIRTGEQTFKAVSRVCPHAGCVTNWLAESKIFQCPCHGSTFNNRGCLRTGPANMSLPTYTVQYDQIQQKVFIYAIEIISGC